LREKWCFLDGKFVVDRGELHGKRGDLAPRFRGTKNMPLFSTLFSVSVPERAGADD
jgi:hypothetical protein